MLCFIVIAPRPAGPAHFQGFLAAYHRSIPSLISQDYRTNNAEHTREHLHICCQRKRSNVIWHVSTSSVKTLGMGQARVTTLCISEYKLADFCRLVRDTASSSIEAGTGRTTFQHHRHVLGEG